MTPRRLSELLAAHVLRSEDALDLAITTAWMTASMSRPKKLRPLAHYLRKRDRRRQARPLPPEERSQVAAAARRLADRLNRGRNAEPDEEVVPDGE